MSSLAIVIHSLATLGNTNSSETNPTTLITSSLRIAIVTETFPPEINGVAMTIGRLVQGLRSRGHAVHLIRPRQSSADIASTSTDFHEDLVIGLSIPKYQGLKFGLPTVLHLRKLWQKDRPDLVHVVTEGPLGWAAVNVAKHLQIPVTSSFHTNFHSYTGHYGIGFLNHFTARYLRNLHNATAATFVPTKSLIEELRIAGYRNLSLMSRGVDTDLYQPMRRSEALRQQWGLAEDDLAVIYVGRIAAEKNISLVLAAFSEISKVNARAKMIWVGDGPLREKMQHAHPQAIFTGSKTGAELASHYASGDLFLFPSVTETFGNVTSEALASGLCVLAYDRAAAGELIQSYENGVKVPSHDDRAFIAAAVELSQNAELRKRLSSEASASIAHLAWANVYDAFIGRLQSVIASHRQG